MADINRERLLQYLELIDSGLKGVTRKVDLFCIGGTALTLCKMKNVSEDIDLMISQKDFVHITGVTAEIEHRHKVRIDLMREGEVFDYFLPPDYKTRAKRYPTTLKNINLYVLSDVDIVLMKALSGRAKDYGDIVNLAKTIGKEELIRRFHELRFKRGKRQECELKLNTFFHGANPK
jgi:hypothetical protein